MRTGLVIAALSIILSGCVSTPETKTASQSVNSASYEGQQAFIVREKPVDFHRVSRLAGGFGALGAIAAISQAKVYAKEVGLVEPTPGVETALAEHAITKFGLSGLGEIANFPKKQSASEIAAWAKARGHSGIAIDVQTIGWSYLPSGFGFDGYDVGYGADLQIVDLQSGRKIGSHRCMQSASKQPGGRIYKEAELTANNSALLKQIFASLGQACVAEFKAKAL